ncbi:MAG TPA: SRPBCC domain-containing protein [Fimbriimonadaceae bacterium]|nr:SRPBCC domain-containing protein [Fimbriimonadaceae bacterium]
MKQAEVSTPSDREVLVKRSFDAPADLVWRAYTEPELMRRWLTAMPGWSMPVCEMTIQVGGTYRWRWRNDEIDQEFGFTGEILEAIMLSKIVHTQVYDPGDMGGSMGDGPSIVTVTFTETNGMTNVETSILFASKSGRDAAMSTGMTEGMEMSYKELDSTLSPHARNET